jgi:hypothetical protein
MWCSDGTTAGRAITNIVSPCRLSLLRDMHESSTFSIVRLGVSADEDPDPVGADFPPIQIVGASSNTTCLSPAKNVIQEFTFDLVGTTEQCGNDVQITWSDTNTSHVGPRSFSIVPLDSSYAPYQVGVSGASGTYTWSPDMKAGTNFTIMMG